MASYIAWYETQQILHEERTPSNNIDLIIKQKQIKQKMIQKEAF